MLKPKRFCCEIPLFPGFILKGACCSLNLFVQIKSADLQSLCTQSADTRTLFIQITRSSPSIVTVSYKASHESVTTAAQKC